MSILGYIVVGLIVGSIAKAILKDRAVGGWLASLVIGVIGAVVGGWLGNLIFDVGLGDAFDLRTWVLALGGSLIVLLVYGAITGRRGSRV